VLARCTSLEPMVCCLLPHRVGAAWRRGRCEKWKGESRTREVTCRRLSPICRFSDRPALLPPIRTTQGPACMHDAIARRAAWPELQPTQSIRRLHPIPFLTVNPANGKNDGRRRGPMSRRSQDPAEVAGCGQISTPTTTTTTTITTHFIFSPARHSHRARIEKS
jgi:hypothetical protein